jgi:nucleotide-binding universal stress UspA family protein
MLLSICSDCFAHEVSMTTNFLRRWSRPKVILIISTLTESPAHTLRVVSGLRTTGAKLFLVQLPAPSYGVAPPRPNIPFLVTAPPSSAEQRSWNGAGQAFLWAEILSEVTVLRNMPVERMPALVDSLAADLVVLTAPEIGRMPFRMGNSVEVDLFGTVPVPIMICGVRMSMDAWSGRDLRKILVPVNFGPDMELYLRFACRFARHHHGRLTVLHVFANSESNLLSWERTPVAVETKLPIQEMKREGIMCPIEIAVSEGYPEPKILAFNERKPHDLIIMGGPPKRGARHGSGASVTESVMAAARCPVLVLGAASVSACSEAAESGSQLSLA